MAQPLRVLVSGASVAGPTTAYWLARAGCQVTIIERYPALRSGGQSIDIRMNAVDIMKKMGPMEKMVRAKFPDFEGFSIVDRNNKSYGTLRSTGDSEQQSLLSEYEIFRTDLAKVLFELTKDDKRIKYVFGEQITALHQKEGVIVADFQEGKLETQEYDLVVAADGATSRTRALGLQCGVRDYVEPHNGWAGYWSIKEDLLNGSKIGTALSTVGGKFTAIGPDGKGGSTCMFMNWLGQNSTEIARFREAQKSGEKALKSYVSKALEGRGWRTDELIKGLLEADDFYASEIVQVKAPTLSKGNFVMVGDAGYATGPTGTGTSMAIMGSYILAGEIRKHPGDLPAALKSYETVMKPIIRQMQKVPSIVPVAMAPQTWWGLMIRNYLFMALVGSGFVNMFQRLFGGPALSTKDNGLVPQYEWPEEKS